MFLPRLLVVVLVKLSRNFTEFQPLKFWTSMLVNVTPLLVLLKSFIVNYKEIGRIPDAVSAVCTIYGVLWKICHDRYSILYGTRDN